MKRIFYVVPAWLAIAVNTDSGNAQTAATLLGSGDSSSAHTPIIRV